MVSNSALQISSNHSRRGPPQSRAEKCNKHKKVTLAYYVLSCLFIYSSLYTLHILSILPRWCFPIPTHLNWGLFFQNPIPFCRIKGILITKLMPPRVETQANRDPRKWTFLLVLQKLPLPSASDSESSPHKSLCACALQAPPSHLASKHHPFHLDS